MNPRVNKTIMLSVAILALSFFFITCSLFESEKPVLFVKPMFLNFTKNANSDILVISNRGDAALSWEITDKSDWVELSKSSGKVTTGEDTVIVSANVNQEGGQYSGTIRIESNGGNKEIILSLDISIWTKKKDMLTTRFGHVVGTVNNKIYAIGGLNGGHSIKTVEEYNPATDTWTTKASMPTARWGHAAGVVNGKIYVIGGYNEGGYYSDITVSTVEEYDPAIDTWTTKAPMPTARWGHAAGVVNGKIYIISGAKGWGTGAPIDVYEITEVYDPITDTWTTKASIPTPRYNLSCRVVNEKIYAIGGSSDQAPFSISTVEEYNPATDTWTTKASMPTARFVLSTGTVNGKIYAIGGADAYPVTVSYKTVEEYDPITDSWITKSPMPIGRFGHAPNSVSIDGKIYVTGGAGGTDWGIGLAEVFVYEPGLE